MLGIAGPASIRQNGTGNAESQPATIQNKDGLNILVASLLAGTLYMELNIGSGFIRFENLTWDLASLPGKGLAVNTTGNAAIFVQLARGMRYRLVAEGTTDLRAQVLDTGNT